MYVVTFYSYKGGVGRSMALANVAAVLAQSGKKVLVADFDLEAPGLPSYAPFAAAAGLPGVVDYVERYRRELQAPDASGYIYRCDLEDGIPIWVMPAGDSSSPGYGAKLAGIDWDVLYREESGFLMFEDLRQQWAAFGGTGFDYVLIDSRTGHTDVGGICTRHLPDAVVVMFVPTDQNVAGLVPIVDDIRTQPRVRDNPVTLHFCPSNVPDVYDENEILAGKLADAAARLGYQGPEGIMPRGGLIHHSTSMELLEQRLVVLSRRRSRLAKEYVELTTAVVERNWADPEGAVAALSGMPAAYSSLPSARDASRTGRVGKMSQSLLDRAQDIVRLHPDNGEVAFLSAQVFSTAGDYEQEETSLALAIELGHKAAQATVMRASALIKLGRRDEARRLLRDVLTSADASVFEFRPAVQLLRAISDRPAFEAADLLGTPGTRPRAKIMLAHIAMTEPALLSDIADRLLEAAQDDDTSPDLRRDILNVAALCLIGARRFQEAIDKVLSERDTTSLASIFNRAIAEWGRDARPPKDLFERVLAEAAGREEADANANLLQCVAVSRSATGDGDGAREALLGARSALVSNTIVFSCWSFTYKEIDAMMEDLDVMRRLVDEGRPLVPAFFGTGD